MIEDAHRIDMRRFAGIKNLCSPGLAITLIISGMKEPTVARSGPSTNVNVAAVKNMGSRSLNSVDQRKKIGEFMRTIAPTQIM